MIKNKNMKKGMIVCTILAVGTTALAGCGKSELLKMLENGTQIEIEVTNPDFVQSEQGTESAIEWEELAFLTTNQTLRDSWDNQLLIIKFGDGKNGVLFVNQDGQHENNNTLSIAIHNRGFQKIFEEEDTLEKLASSVAEQYADIEASPDKNDILKQVYTGINGYFNLLPDNETNYANPDSTLTRADFLAMVFRVDTPVKELEADSLTDAVGKSDLNIYAQGALKDSYLDTESKSLNNMTYNGSITRAEVVYTLVSRYFSDELSTVDTQNIKFSDAKDGGDIASQQKFDATKDYWKSYELTYALQNPDKGMPTSLYNALCVARQKGFIGEETRWDEAVTKSEAMELLCKALIADDSIPTFDHREGATTTEEDQKAQDDQKKQDETTENTGGGDSTGVDGQFEEGEYRGDEEAKETDVEALDQYLIDMFMEDYENGKITEEELNKLLEELASLNADASDTQGTGGKSQQQSQPPVHNTPEADALLEEETPEGNYVFGQGDYTGLEGGRIN